MVIADALIMISVGGFKAAPARIRDLETIDTELHLVAALRHVPRERGGPLPSMDVPDALLDECRELTTTPQRQHQPVLLTGRRLLLRFHLRCINHSMGEVATTVPAHFGVAGEFPTGRALLKVVVRLDAGDWPRFGRVGLRGTPHRDPGRRTCSVAKHI